MPPPSPAPDLPRYFGPSRLFRNPNHAFRAWLSQGGLFWPKSPLIEGLGLPLYIWVSDYAVSGPGFFMRRAPDPHFERLAVILVTAGNCLLQKGDAVHKAEAGEVLLLPLSGFKAWKAGDAGFFHHRCVEIAGPGLKALLAGLSLAQKVVLTPASLAEMKRMLKEANRIAGEARPDALFELSKLAYALLVELCKSASGPPLPASLRRAVEFIQAHPERSLSIAEIARAAGLGVSRLGDLFRENLGSSPAQYGKSYRLEAAYQRLALDPGLSVKELAHEFGFETAANFSRLFKRRFGRLPGRPRPASRE